MRRMMVAPGRVGCGAAPFGSGGVKCSDPSTRLRRWLNGEWRMAADGAGPTQRLDRFLWFARVVKTRAIAQSIAEDGHLRIDGRTVDRAHAPVRPGNVLTFPLHGRVRVIRIETLPTRRGPAREARACYADLSPEPVRTTCSNGEDVDARVSES